VHGRRRNALLSLKAESKPAIFVFSIDMKWIHLECSNGKLNAGLKRWKLHTMRRTVYIRKTSTLLLYYIRSLLPPWSHCNMFFNSKSFLLFATLALASTIAARYTGVPGHLRGGSRLPIKAKYPLNTGGLKQCEPQYFEAPNRSPHVVVPAHFGDFHGTVNRWEASEAEVSEDSVYKDMTFRVIVTDNLRANPPYQIINASITAMGDRAHPGKWYFHISDTEDWTVKRNNVQGFFLENFGECIISQQLVDKVNFRVKSVMFQEYFTMY
jgi:hypothetical protein